MAGKENENGVTGGFQFHLPDNRSKWENFQRAIYNPSANEFLGRTAKSWGQILFFYTIYYIVLSALFMLCMQGLLLTLDDKAPKWQLDSSLIGINPGLGFRPISNNTDEGSLIWYDMKNETTRRKWIDLLDDFLKQYPSDQTGKNYDSCDYGKRAGEGKVCPVDLSKFNKCRPDTYGYNTSSPCVFIKLNKIFGWKPEYITDASEFGDNERLKDAFNGVTNAEERERIWISCEGQDAADRENVQDFDYFPEKGIPGYYFPYTNNDNYLSPLIAVQVLNPKPNVIISIECRAWAKNIKYTGGNLYREGSIRFEILVDNNDEAANKKLLY